MTKGISLHIGINEVDARHYGSPLRLLYCDNDAMYMKGIAEENGFKTKVLINSNATSYKLYESFAQAADHLEDGDIFFLTFSGHGDIVKDKNGDEADGYDEAILLYDRIIIDDQLYYEWSKFKPGVRILFICDSCYSGTITKRKEVAAKNKKRTSWILGKMLEKYPRIYQPSLNSIPSANQVDLSCTVMLISASQEDQTAQAASRNDPDSLSPFTSIIREVWENGEYAKDYCYFFSTIQELMEARNFGHKPNCTLIGSNKECFEGQRPFSI